MTNTTLLNALLCRRSAKPKFMTTPAPTAEQLEICARAALRAPDNGALHPYRFVSLSPESREKLAVLFTNAARAAGKDEQICARIASKATKAPAMIAIIGKMNLESNIPVLEQMLTAGAAMEHFMLALDAQGFVGFIGSGFMLEDDAVQEFLIESPDEEVLGWILTGTPTEDRPIPEAETGKAPITFL